MLCVGVGGREVLLAILPLLTDPNVSSLATSIREYSVMLASFPGLPTMLQLIKN